MTQNLTPAPEVNRTPAGLFVPTFGPVDLTLVNHAAGQPVNLTPGSGQPVNLTADPGQPVNPTPVNLIAPVNSTRPDPDPAAPTLTEPPADSPAGQVSGSAGQADPLTVKPPRRGIFRRRPRAAAAPGKPEVLPKWLDRAEMSVLWAVAGVVTYLASFGQVRAAEEIAITDHRKWLVPVGLELVAIALFLRGYVVGRQGFSPWPAWLAGLGVGGFAVYQVHAHAPNTDQGVLFGAFTAGALLLWLAKLVYALWKFRRDSNTSAGGHLKFGKLWRDNPRLTRHAARIGRRFQLDDVDTAMEYAEVMVFVLDNISANNATLRRRIAARKRDLAGATVADQQTIRDDIEDLKQRILSDREQRRMAWRVTQAHAGRPVAELPSFVDVERIALVEQPRPAPAPAPAAGGTAGPPPATDEVDDVDLTVEAEDAVAAWEKDINEQPTPRKRRPANAPTSPAPAGTSKSPFVRHAKAIDMVTKSVDRDSHAEPGHWKRRAEAIKFDEVVAAKPVKANGDEITGKGTLLDIRWLIEILSDRADQVPDHVYNKFGLTREGGAAK